MFRIPQQKRLKQLRIANGSNELNLDNFFRACSRLVEDEGRDEIGLSAVSPAKNKSRRIQLPIPHALSVSSIKNYLLKK
jgi:hypothetical protein